MSLADELERLDAAQHRGSAPDRLEASDRLDVALRRDVDQIISALRCQERLQNLETAVSVAHDVTMAHALGSVPDGCHLCAAWVGHGSALLAAASAELADE